MEINPINNGIVIDHIESGKGLEVYNFLKLSDLDCTIALIQNVPSKKTGKKDIIKIDAELQLDFNVMGYIAPEAVINYIKDGKVINKIKVELPSIVKNVIKCKNPRCITSVENVEHVFKLVNKEDRVYRCIYCESQAE